MWVVNAGNFLNNLHFTRDDFSIAAGEVFRDFCFEGPQKSDLSKWVELLWSFEIRDR